MKIKVIQRNDLKGKNGTCPLFIRFTHERKVKYVGLGLSILPEHWNGTEQRIKDECTERKEYQFVIDSKLNEYHKKIQRFEVLEMKISFEACLTRIAVNLQIKLYQSILAN